MGASKQNPITFVHKEYIMEPILIIFYIANLGVPGHVMGPEVSESSFSSKEQCARYVMQTSQAPVDKEGKFVFVSADNFMFVGQCATMEEVERELNGEGDVDSLS